MKIHVFINCYWGTGMSGGDRRVLEQLKRWKDTLEYSFIVYTTVNFYEIMKSEGINHLKIELVDVQQKKKRGIISAYIQRTRNCQKLLRNNISSGDVLYSPTDILPDILPAAMVKMFYQKEGYRWCMITHHIYERFYNRPGNKIVNFISCSQQKLAIFLGKKYADVIMTPSPIVYQYFREKSFPMDKVVMTSNAVDNAFIDASNLDIKGYDACFLARLNYSKGIFELPEIWDRVVKRYPDAQLAVMGRGSEEIVKQMTEIIEKKKLQNNIKLLGYVESEEAYSIMKKSKVFLFTSHEEGWGIALAEALVCQTPVVAYELSVFNYIFKVGTNLCKLKDVDEMAEKVCYLLEHEEERISQGIEGRKYILSHYSLDAVAQNDLDILLSREREYIDG